MTLKIAIGGIEHETNTHRTADADLSDFKITRGHAILAANEGVRSYVGGMLDAAASIGASVVPLIHAQAEPAGIISLGAYEQLVRELLEGLRSALPVDAVGLALHGAGIARGAENIEVDICRRVRQVVGSDVKVVITLDLHGNLSPELFELVDAAFGTKDSPHTDMFERGEDAIKILPGLIGGNIVPKIHIEKLPLLLTPVTTMKDATAAINQMCRTFEEDADIIACTFFHGFPYADTRFGGASVLAVANGSMQKAQSAAKSVARFIWNSRADIPAKTFAPEAAIKHALAEKNGPVAVLDGADNTGGGCPGDGTYLLRAMLEAKLSGACFGVMCDPEVVSLAHETGVGATVDVQLGGKSDRLHGEPIAARAYVKTLTDGSFVRRSPMGKGTHDYVGRTARLQIGGVDVVVVSERYQPYDPEIFSLHGIDVRRASVVGLKSTNHWRAGFDGIIRSDYLADSPGLMSQDLTLFSHERAPRPIWPLDKDTTY
ncbi:M81 family metallopeptidase [Sinorhizobium medicae]|uniref:M81 family metallopeptidase n=1 Tax=Sinorhizobium medicae TaxID=110321 RepID=UPI0012959AB5|nr:M81 family metallopeptidase [Sinorhizobium medicae]MDX0967874.1 MlrC domain protein [Sinorhizobium medicae]MQV49881.1 MlrC domain protein [Sinorhizobium medicae]MQV55666.1 MlrC domain protein [Sinorhizobium medicae]MQV75331.1 MlrC domain protein [Sinorhizobium medicae]WQO88513.1 M81 family metallopeptidase [Sinorhizobium medicae]